MRSRGYALAAALTAVVFTGACSASPRGDSTSHPSSTGGTSATGRSTGSTGGGGKSTGTSGSDDPSRDDLTHESVVRWSGYKQVSDNQLRFSFASGDKRCYGSRVVVEETSTTIDVATISGTLPDAPDMCTTIARQATVLVTTSQPIAGRQVRQLVNVKVH